MIQFKNALTAIAVALDRPISAAYLDGMCAILSEYDEDTLVAAAAKLAKVVKWLPKPCEFVSLIAEGILPGEDTDAAAMEAWAKLQNVMSSAESVRDLCADPRVAAGVNALGGWFTMRNSAEEPRWQRKTFVEAFKGATQSARVERLGLTAGEGVKQIGGGS